jgi:hypothetical protein
MPMSSPISTQRPPRVSSRWIALLVAFTFFLDAGLACAEVPPGDEATPRAFPVRAVKVRGDLSDEAVAAHIDFALGIGFNALWIPSGSAGRWVETETADPPQLFPEFLELADRCAQRGVRVYLVVEPVRDAQGVIALSNPQTAKRLVRFMRLARRQARVHDFVISFHGAGLRLTELSDLLAYGRIAAPAHVALTARLVRKLGADDRAWFAPSIYSDEHLDDSRLRYSEALLEAIAGLDQRVGIVWSGPRATSPSITAGDVAATRARFGGRPLMLDDRFPANGSGERMPLALILGPLRDRDPGLHREIAAYVSTPMGELGASRLALLTVVSFLTDPNGYDADHRWLEAMKRLAGDDPAALRTLRTQATEWGGWIAGANYHTALDENPQTAAQSLRDPAAVAAWSWPERTYPERMAGLAAVEDARFRDDLLLTMARRLAVARAVPVVHEILAVSERPDGGGAPLLNEIQTQRRNLVDRPEILVALDRFLYHAGLGPALIEQEAAAERESEP